MSEGVFLLPRNANTVGLLRSGPQTFGIAGQLVSAKPGCLYQFSVLNKSATVYYLQIHDKATAPVAADVPIFEFKLPASDGVTISFQLAGLYLANGLGLAISSTPAALTLAIANDAVAYTRYTAAG